MAIFVPILKEYGRLESLHITVCNVGSRKLDANDDYATQGWGVFAPNLTIYGFDADPEACEEANANIGLRQENGEVNWTEIHIPIGLGSFTGEAKLYVTKNPMCSSLYPPNEPYLARFSGLPELVNLDFEVDIEVTTLDNFCQTEAINEIDFLQIDVQGADLDVLRGASKILDSVLAIQIEVEFSHLYKEQPLFADIDTYLRNNGFSLFDLTNSRRNRTNSPIQSTVHPGQLLWGDAFYLRDLIDQNPHTLPKNLDRIFKLACIADVMNFSDYALELLKYLTVNYGATEPAYNFADIIIASLTQFPQLVIQGISTLPLFLELRDYITKYDISELEPQEISKVNV
jgi:FkbM family methyltransferase